MQKNSSFAPCLSYLDGWLEGVRCGHLAMVVQREWCWRAHGWWHHSASIRTARCHVAWNPGGKALCLWEVLFRFVRWVCFQSASRLLPHQSLPWSQPHDDIFLSLALFSCCIHLSLSSGTATDRLQEGTWQCPPQVSCGPKVQTVLIRSDPQMQVELSHCPSLGVQDSGQTEGLKDWEKSRRLPLLQYFHQIGVHWKRTWKATYKVKSDNKKLKCALRGMFGI